MDQVERESMMDPDIAHKFCNLQQFNVKYNIFTGGSAGEKGNKKGVPSNGVMEKRLKVKITLLLL